jgi:hypothetical protein
MQELKACNDIYKKTTQAKSIHACAVRGVSLSAWLAHPAESKPLAAAITVYTRLYGSWHFQEINTAKEFATLREIG